MGSGKSRLGRYLSTKLNLRFEDLDDCIQHDLSMSIPEIFNKYGQDYFRQIERDTLVRKSTESDRILSLGGGSLSSQEIVDSIRSSNTLVFIAPDFETLINRIQGKSKRPLVMNSDGSFKSKDELYADLKPLYDARVVFYEQAHLKFVPDPKWSPFDSGERLYKMIKDHKK